MISDVQVQPCRQGKRLWTVGTQKWLLAAMRRFVLLQIFPMNKRLVANVAFVRPVDAVVQQVSIQFRRRRKRTAALIAREWPHLAMAEHVQAEVALIGEFSLAVHALENVIVCGVLNVSVDMLQKIIQITINTAAQLTTEQFWHFQVWRQDSLERFSPFSQRRAKLVLSWFK